MIDASGAKVPFIQNESNPKYPFIVLCDDDGFLIAQGVDRDFDPNILSVGVRWRRSRSEETNKPNPLGFPLARGTAKCWLMLPDDIAVCVLSYLKDKTPNSNRQIEKSEIDKAIQILKNQISQRSQND